MSEKIEKNLTYLDLAKGLERDFRNIDTTDCIFNKFFGLKKEEHKYLIEKLVRDLLILAHNQPRSAEQAYDYIELNNILLQMNKLLKEAGLKVGGNLGI